MCREFRRRREGRSVVRGVWPSILWLLDCCVGRGGGGAWTVGGRCIGGGVEFCGIREACGRGVGSVGSVRLEGQR